MIRSVAGAVVLGLALAACGGGGTSSEPEASSGSEPSAVAASAGGQTAEGLCGAVTEEMAVAALGGPVGEPQSGDVLGGPGIFCHYALASDDNVSVEAQLSDMTEAEFEETATALSMTEPLDGVADAAYQKANGMMGLPGTSILVRGGGRGVTVVITVEGDAAGQLAAAIVIAEAALAS